MSTATITSVSSPHATLTANPIAISAGQQSQLSWNLSSGTFVDAEMDQGTRITPATSGSVQVSPSATTTYRIFVATEEGGSVAEATVWVDEDPPSIFSDGFESGNTSAWSAAVSGGS
jgi:hypothetical protein